MITIYTKRGDTFAAFCQRVDANGAPIDLTGLTISSEIRLGTFSQALTVSVTDAVNGLFTISATPANTELWPISGAYSKMYLDVQFDDGNYVISSDTIQVNVTLDMTQVTSASTGVPAASGNPLIFKDRAQPSGQTSSGLTLESALMYQGPTGPVGPQGPMGDVTAAALTAEANAQAAATAAATSEANSAASETNAAASATAAATSETNAAASATAAQAAQAAIATQGYIVPDWTRVTRSKYGPLPVGWYDTWRRGGASGTDRELEWLNAALLNGGAFVDASSAVSPYDLTTPILLNASAAQAAPGDTVSSVADLSDVASGPSAVQANASYQPAFGLAPLSPRVNLLPYSNTPTMPVWTIAPGNGLFQTSIGPNTTGPYGNVPKIVPNSGADISGGTTMGISEAPSYADAAATHNMSFIAKPAEFSGVRVRQYNYSSGGQCVDIDVANKTWTGPIHGFNTINFLDLPDGFVQIDMDYVPFSITECLIPFDPAGVLVADGTNGIYIDRLQISQGSGLQSFQSVDANGLSITQDGVPSPGFLRFDGVNDQMAQTFPNGFAGDLVVCGRKGSWVEQGVNIAAGSALTLSRTTSQLSELFMLDVIGDVCGWVAIPRTLLDWEQQEIVDMFRGRGALGRLNHIGPELVQNGTFNTDLTGWTVDTGATASVVSGAASITTTDASYPGMHQTLTCDLGAIYKITGDIQNARLYVCVGGAVNNNHPASWDLSALTSISGVFLASSTAMTLALRPLYADGTTAASFDNISVKKITPEAA